MTTKLNSGIRDSIIENALKAANFEVEREKIRQSRADWVEKVRVEALGGEADAKSIDIAELKVKEIAGAFDERLIARKYIFNQGYSIYVTAAGEKHRVFFNGSLAYDHKETQVYKVTPDTHTLTKGHVLADAFIKITERDNKLSNARLQMMQDVRAVVNSVKTVEQLLDTWPECEAFIPKDVQTPAETKGAPDRLNKALGLTPKKSLALAKK